MKYFEIKPETEAYKTGKRLFEFQLDWLKPNVQDDLEKTIGIGINKNLELDTKILRLQKIPPGTLKEFRPGIIRGCYEAKVHSSINKRYLEIVKKYDLKVYTMWDLIPFFKTPNLPRLQPIVLDSGLRLFFEVNNDNQKILDKFRSDIIQLQEHKESQYLALRLEMAIEFEKKEENENQEKE